MYGQVPSLPGPDNYLLLSVVPVKIYVNVDVKKLEILRENKGRSGGRKLPSVPPPNPERGGGVGGGE